MRKLRTILIWGLVSVGLQIGFLYYLEHQIKGDANASTTPQPPKIIQTTVSLTGTNIKNLQASYNKDYLAFYDSQGFKVVAIKTGKVVFEEAKPAKGELLGYHWLPDRNTLLFVTTRANPKAKGSSVVSRSEPNFRPLIKEDPLEKTPSTTPATTPTPAPAPKPAPPAIPSQLTELYTVDFAATDEESPPDRKLGRRLDGFPAGSTIQSMDVSTYTNLIYLMVKTSNGQLVYEIDVMANVRTVQRSGEKISRMVVSDKKGTLYLQSILSGTPQIVAVKHSGREQVLKGSEYVLLGVDAGKLLVGLVQEGHLSSILSLNDQGVQDKSSSKTSTMWTGQIPWKSSDSVEVSNNFISLFDGQRIVVLDNGKERAVTPSGDDNYLTSDGREVMEVRPNGDGTVQVNFKPL